MDVLQVDDKKYIKATKIAHTLGYSSDYVGQLCRSGKVEAKLVGRSWYVLEGSIGNHKQERYRSTQATSVKAIKNAVEQKIQEKTVTASKGPLFYTHSSYKKMPSYEQDDTELFPQTALAKNTHAKLKIGLADASAVRVTSHSEAFDFVTPSMPKTVFKGTLVVNDYKEDSANTLSGGTVIHPKEVEQLKVHKTFKNKAISSKRVLKGKNIKHIFVQDTDSLLPLNVVLKHKSKENNTLYSFFLIFFVLLSSVGIFFALLTLESHVSTTSEGVHTTYALKGNLLLPNLQIVFQKTCAFFQDSLQNFF